MTILTDMVMGTNKRTLPHLYIEEHMRARHVSDTKMAGLLAVARETVYRWRTEQHRLNPEKIAAIAQALNVKPEDLWSLPTKRINLNSLAKNLDDQDFEIVETTLKRLANRP